MCYDGPIGQLSKDTKTWDQIIQYWPKGLEFFFMLANKLNKIFAKKKKTALCIVKTFCPQDNFSFSMVWVFQVKPAEIESP